MSAVRPMKPPTERLANLHKLRFPLIGMPKLNGIRCLNVAGVSQSASGKRLPNLKLQDMFANSRLHGLDGELIVGDPTAHDVWNKTTSVVNSFHGDTEDLTWYVFDTWSCIDSYLNRLIELESLTKFPKIKFVPYVVLHSLQQLEVFYNQTTMQGYEGVILRSPIALYKHGRSTFSEQGMLRIKPLEHSEAEVLTIEELMHNANPLEESELGFAKRSSAQDGLVGMDTCGALGVRDIHTGVVFCLSGFSDELKAELWKTRPVGKILKYAYFPVGMKDKPLQPRFEGWRDSIDMTEY